MSLTEYNFIGIINHEAIFIKADSEEEITISLNKYNFIGIENGKAIFIKKDPAEVEQTSQQQEEEKMRTEDVTILYEKWLDGYIEKGGIPTHHYDYPFERLAGQFQIARDGDVIDPLFGSQSKVYIIPEEVNNITINGLGHSEVLYMENYTAINGDFIPVCNDLKSPSGNTKVNAVLEENKKAAIEEDEKFREEMRKQEEEFLKKNPDK